MATEPPKAPEPPNLSFRNVWGGILATIAAGVIVVTFVGIKIFDHEGPCEAYGDDWQIGYQGGQEACANNGTGLYAPLNE